MFKDFLNSILFDGGMEVSRHAGALSYRGLLEFSGISD